ncbi:MAG TPA: MarR family winged helix-turn-helix transcriptional regulator [Thermoleophilaceae bacterium]
MQAGRLAMERTAAALEPLGLEVAQFATLAMIDRLQPITQAALAERLGISKSAISRVVIRLVADGLVVQRLPWRDARRRDLYVTAAGAELMVSGITALARVDARLAAHIGDDAIRALPTLAPPNLTPVQTALRALGWAIPA